jgi:LEA14-like dessication related protein
MKKRSIFGLVSGAGFFFVLGIALSLVQGCASLFTPPSVEIVGVELVAVGLTDGLAEVTLEVTNERFGDLDIKGILYELEVSTTTEGGGWTTLSSGFFDGPVSVRKGQTERVKIPVPFEYRTVGEAVLALLRQGEVPYRLSGEVWLGGSDTGLPIPFRMQGILRP